MIKSIKTHKTLTPNEKAKELIFVSLNHSYNALFNDKKITPNETKLIQLQIDKRITQINRVLLKSNLTHKIGDI